MKFTVTRAISTQQKLSRKLVASKKTIAVVPTMGYLHEGHLSLIKRGLKLADVVVTTIFVNPTQFGPGEDFKRYPRDAKGDLGKVQKAGGKVVFMPKMDDMYPDDFETYVNVEKLTKTLEGESRPTHFRGVTTIVTKLFNIVRPDVALFGMKDYQQAMVLQQMVRDLNWPIKLVVCPTIREKDGLALSSRNDHLSPEQRQQATALYQALKSARKLCLDGETRISILLHKMHRIIKDAAPTAKVDYIAFTDMESLKPVTRVQDNTVASLAVRLGPIRLIDNMKIA
jgi:pantoate--beta-alanine ligase